MPTTPGCHWGRGRSAARGGPAPSATAPCAARPRGCAASTCWRCRLIASSAPARPPRLHVVVGQQQLQPQIGLTDAPRGIDTRAEQEPAGARRGRPRWRPRPAAARRCRRGRCAPSPSAPGVTKARLIPTSGIMSHTVASATRSSSASRSGSARPAKKPRRRSQPQGRRSLRRTPPRWRTAPPARCCRPRDWGFTTACAVGGRWSETWWSSTSTSARPATAASGSAAAVPQSTHTIRLAPREAQRAHRRRVGPVTLGQPVGDVADHRAPEAAQEQRQQRAGARPVHVVIAEHGDGLGALDGPPRGARRRRPCRAATDGSGSRARRVGSRKSAAASMPIPRAARRWPTISGRAPGLAFASNIRPRLGLEIMGAPRHTAPCPTCCASRSNA